MKNLEFKRPKIPAILPEELRAVFITGWNMGIERYENLIRNLYHEITPAKREKILNENCDLLYLCNVTEKRFKGKVRQSKICSHSENHKSWSEDLGAIVCSECGYKGRIDL